MSETHSYAIWDAESEITLCNIPWDSGYKNVVRFANTDALNEYIDGLPTENKKVISPTTYVRAEQPVMLEDPFNTVNRYNYLRVRQPGQNTTPPEESKDFFYFITGVTHVAPNTTAVSLQLDIFQSFFYDVTFGRCYVERGHVGIAQANQMIDYGKRYLTAEEALSPGGDYVNKIVDYTVSMDDEQVNPNFETNTDYLVVSNISLSLGEEYWGTEADPKQPVPSISGYFGMVTGMSIAHVTRPGLGYLLQRLEKYPWVASGIIGIYAIPRYKNYHPDYVYPPITQFPTPPGETMERVITAVRNWRDSPALNTFTGRYANLKKFLTYPYTYVEITSNTGNSIILKPELMESDDITVRENVAPYLGDMSIRYYPGMTYNNDPDNDALFTMVSNLPTVGAVADAGAAALARQVHQRNYATSAADMAMVNSDIGRTNQRQLNDIQTRARTDQAGAATDLARSQWSTSLETQRSGNDARVLGINDSLRNSVAGGVLGGAGSGIGGALAGGITAGVGGLYAQDTAFKTNMITNQAAINAIDQNYFAGQDFANRSLEIANSLSADTLKANNATSKLISEQNYELAIEAIEAQAMTTALTPPSVIGQSGGETGRYVRNGLGVYVKVKTINAARVRAIGEFWLRYGYTVNAYMNIPEDLQTMEKFTFWKMTEAVILRAPMPEVFKNVIRSIFESGVTVWRDPDTIGTLDPADNEPIVRNYY